MIYLDHAATVPMREEALKAMTAALREDWGNASPTYPIAQRAKARLDGARTILADTIHAGWRELFFTSGGTESDNWALIGTAEALKEKGKHIVVSAIEHHAVLHTCEYLESRGFEVTRLPADGEGLVRPQELAAVLDARPDTILVSLMAVNNEIGTIEPIDVCCKYAHDHGVLFHTDAVQAYGKLPLSVEEVPVDLLSVSAHKIGGPKGIGFLYIRNGVQPQALIHGGSQESGRRAGTENVPAAVGFAAAAQEAMAEMQEEQAREAALQQYFAEGLHRLFGDYRATGKKGDFLWNGAPIGPRRAVSNLSISFPGLDTQALLINLDLAGICASGGSACTTGAVDPSHVITAICPDPAVARGTLRFTLGPENTNKEIDTVLRELKAITERMKTL